VYRWPGIPGCCMPLQRSEGTGNFLETEKASTGPMSMKTSAWREYFAGHQLRRTPDSLPTDYALQRTRSASLRSPLMRRSFGRWVLFLALGSSVLRIVGCASVPHLQPDELAVIDATLMADWSCVGIDDPSRLSVDLRTSLAGLQDLSTVDFFRWPVENDRDLNFRVPVALMTRLREANRRSIPIESPVARTRFGTDRRLRTVSLSRPAFLASGEGAVVAIAISPAPGQLMGCESGFIAYLSREGESWRVQGFGAFWIT
jgi:hypothetical protein